MNAKIFAGPAMACLLASSFSVVAVEDVSAPQVVEAIEVAFGVSPGERRNHTKGTCAAGYFVGTKEAASLSRSRLFNGQSIPVIARFSLAGGNPKVSDTARSGRGMALEFKLPEGRIHHMTMLNTPIFGSAHPSTFFDQHIAMKPDPITGKPDPEAIKAFKASHPDSKPQADFLAANNPPTSYANSAFFGIHTFKFLDTSDKETLVRWQFVPQDGEKRLTDAEMKSAGPDFLEAALIERTKQGAVRWDMLVWIGQPGDVEDDPTVLWPSDRKQFKAGTLTLTSATPQKGAECEPINFNPLVMEDGIEATNDPVLRFRSPAYAVSFGKRLTGK